MLTEPLIYGTAFDYDYTPETLSLTDFDRLIRAAKYAANSHHRFRIGCVATKSGRIMAISTNRYKSHPKIPPLRTSMHAEMYALSKMSDPANTTLYVARLDKSDLMCLAKPCLYCIAKMLELGVDRVVFSDGPNSASSFHLKTVSSSLLG
jgi:tRNA(Arg) A34 adenosine deaminase TadA